MSGLVWPDTGTSVPATVKDVFGPRPFSAHIATVGYDYDFHRGVDMNLAAGAPYYAGMGGHVVRLHRTHYGWETATQLNFWTTDDDSSSAPATFTRVAPSTLRITGTRSGTGSFPSVCKFKANTERVQNTGDWEFRVKLASTTDPAGGKFGFGIIHEATGEHVSLEWDGVNATALGAGSGGALASNGTTRAVTTEAWLRIYLTGTTLSWGVSSDASTWTNVASQTIASYTDTAMQTFVPILYWRSTDTNGTPATIDLDFAGWYDTNTVDRFGNWITIVNGSRKACSMHFQDISVSLGDIVEPGQLLGYVGLTGYDARSGIIVEPHVHFEYVPVTSPVYTATESINPLAPSLLPRVDVSNNVSVTRTTANDPDAVSSWRLQIIVTRASQDFDLNSVTLTGNLASRTINFDTRSGLNVDNDIPKQSGVYIVPVDFTESSSTYEVSVYFNKSVVGTTFTSASVANTAGTTLWSE